MTKQEAKQELLGKTHHGKNYENNFVDTVYGEIIAYIEKKQHKAKSWEAHCALQEVIEYLEGQ